MQDLPSCLFNTCGWRVINCLVSACWLLCGASLSSQVTFSTSEARLLLKVLTRLTVSFQMFDRVIKGAKLAIFIVRAGGDRNYTTENSLCEGTGYLLLSKMQHRK